MSETQEGASAHAETVRGSLGECEAALRELALGALAAWQATGIVSRDRELFVALAALERPTFGSWNGLIVALRRVRRDALRGAEEVRTRVEGATGLTRALDALQEKLPAELAETLGRLAELARRKDRPARRGEALAATITVRNRVAHDPPANGDPWWNRACEALTPLLPHLTLELSAGGLARPWFFEAGDGEVLAFTGLEPDGAARYAGRHGGRHVSAELGAQVLESIQALLGRTADRADDLRRLLAQLAPEETAGFLLGDYLVGAPVGEGGFARVHRAVHLPTGRRVALKLLHDGAHEETRARFRQEAALLARFAHPGIVSVLGHDEGPWTASRLPSDAAWLREWTSRAAPIKTYMALEWIEGPTLEDEFLRIAAGAPDRPDLRAILGWFLDASRALEVVHATDLIHRDLKPQNLMLSDGRVKLMDFGIARRLDERRTVVTREGTTLGTPAYMSPEQLRAADAELEVGPASDVYQLGATFYELITGVRLYDHDRATSDAVARQKLDGVAPTPPRVHVPRLPREVDALLLATLEPELDHRYPSAEVLSRDLERLLRDEPLLHRPPSLVRRAALAYRRNRTVASLTGLFATVLVGLGLAYVRGVQRERDATEEQRDRADAEARSARTAEGSARAAEAIAIRRAYEARAAADESEALAGGALDDLARVAAERHEWQRSAALYAASLSREDRPARRADTLVSLEHAWQVATLPHGAAVNDLAWAGEGARLASAAKDGKVRVWRGAEEVARLDPVHEPWGAATCVAWVSTSTLAFAAEDGRVRLWDTTGTDAPVAFEGAVVRRLAWSSSCKLLLYGTVDGVVGSCTPAPGATPVARIVNDGVAIADLCALSDGRLAYVLERSGSLYAVTVVDPTGVQDGSMVEPTFPRVPWARSTASSPDGTQLAVGYMDRRVVLLRPDAPADAVTLVFGDEVRGLDWSPDGRRVALAGTDRLVRVIDAGAGSTESTLHGHEGAVERIRWRPDGQQLASASADGTVRLWTPPRPAPTLSIQGELSSVAWQPGGDVVALSAHDDALRLWNVATGELHLKPDTAGLDVAWSPDGRRVASVRGDTVRVVDVASRRIVLERDHRDPAEVAWSADGQLLLCASAFRSHTLSVWDATSGALLATLDGVGGPFASSRALLALTSADRGMLLSELRREIPLELVAGARLAEGCQQVAWSPDGRLLALSRGDVVVLWDAGSGREVASLEHSGAASATVAWSPDGRFLATGGGDGRALVWAAASGRDWRAVVAVSAHAGWVADLDWSPDGRRLVTASFDGTARVWNLERLEASPSEIVEAARQRTGLVAQGIEAVAAASADMAVVASMTVTGDLALDVQLEGGERRRFEALVPRAVNGLFLTLVAEDDVDLMFYSPLDDTGTVRWCNGRLPAECAYVSSSTAAPLRPGRWFIDAVRPDGAPVTARLTIHFGALDEVVGRPTVDPWTRALAREYQGDLQGALGDLDALLARTPEDAKSLYARARVRHTLGDVLGAGLDFERACATNKAYATQLEGAIESSQRVRLEAEMGQWMVRVSSERRRLVVHSRADKDSDVFVRAGFPDGAPCISSTTDGAAERVELGSDTIPRLAKPATYYVMVRGGPADIEFVLE